MEEDSVMASAAEEAEAEAEAESRRRRPRDLLRRLGSVGNFCEESADANGADSDEIELSLGLSLSLGGCFGPDSNPNPYPYPYPNLNPTGKIKLSRSSSLASFSPFADAAAAGDNASSLVRTCSLPTETDEERRQRKEIESLKRLQAKRKRLDRRNSIKSTGSARDTADEDSDPISPISFNGCRRRHHHHRILTSHPPEWPFPPISQASSVGSQGSCSFSSSADFEIKTAAAAAAAGEGNDSSFEIQPLPDNTDHKIAAAMPPTAPTRTETNCSTGQENPIRTLSGRTDSVRKNIMEDMPCVSAKGDGPNGRRIEGFLFKFEKVEDLRIVCVCHGSFLTPAEFVKHAGGGDVAHPLKHIVVNPSPSSLS